MRKPAELWAKIAGEEMNKLTIRELEDEKFLDRDAFDSSLTRIETASLIATRRANKVLALADALYGEKEKGLHKKDEIASLTASMSKEDVEYARDLSSWWSVE